ncbi:MAG: hypothetical protein NT129_02410 [Candidatus Aenigmarchaeota archaeon]|nr:hypothetical protein [Candidatus Aenigmarchaeota archaeon]
MANKDNSNPIYSRIGLGLFILGIILGVFSIKYQFNNNLGSIIFALIILGLGLTSYGLTKVYVKEDKKYQSFLRMFGKVFLVILPLIIILPILGLFIPQLMIVSLIFLAALLVIYPIFMIFFYYKTYKLVRRINTKISPAEKKKQMIILIIVIIVELLLWYVINHIILK